VVLFFISTNTPPTYVCIRGELFFYDRNQAILSKTLTNAHFHSCHNTARSLSNPRTVIIFTGRGKMILAAITEFHGWQGPQRSSRTAPSPEQSQKGEPTCLYVSSPSEPYLDANSLHMEWVIFFHHVTMPILTLYYHHHHHHQKKKKEVSASWFCLEKLLFSTNQLVAWFRELP
jgi:hypothetical protein